MENYYKILQVADFAEIEVIKASYRALCKKYHPDMNSNPDPEKIIKINEAYDILSDEEKKKEYDALLKSYLNQHDSGKRSETNKETNTGYEAEHAQHNMSGIQTIFVTAMVSIIGLIISFIVMGIVPMDGSWSFILYMFYGIIMGKIVRKAGGQYTKVADIKVEEGTNKITDVEPQGNIDILKGSELTLASEIANPPYDDGTPLVLADNAVITNEGTLYVNNTTTTKDFINEVGTVKVESDEILYYVDQYIQGGIANGTVEKVQSSDPNEALALKVKSTFDTYAAAIKAVTLDAVVNDLNSKGPELFNHLPSSGEPWSSAAFYMALSDWMEAVTGTALAESGTPTEISVHMLTLFQSQSGIMLF